ncbi:MAG TPA: xylulokinase [Streptosporangiaceae bacterium]|nr:xylulokinase [Streptosporangiaceae bacterium]
MTRRLVAGVDSSTQSAKVLLVDVGDGTVVARGTAPHTVAGTDGARESDPVEWWDALRAALAQALAQAGPGGDVAAISVGAQQHGLVTLDSRGDPVRPAMLWNDVRAAPQAVELIDALGSSGPGDPGGGAAQWAARAGTVPVASITAAKWAWLRRHEPASAARTAAIRLPHDYLTQRLCGAPVTDRGDASGTGWFSTATDAYDPDILALPLLELDPALLPRVHAPGEVAGTVTPAAATALGLRPGTVVGIGTGDNMAAALGLGLAPGEPVISLGTSGTAYAVSVRRPADPTGVVAGFADAAGAFLPLSATLNCTQAVDRMAVLLGHDREAVEPGGTAVVLPFFDGERTPNLPNAAGLITGLRHDTTAGQLLQATYDGAACTLLTALEQVGSSGDAIAPGAPLILIGGGAKGAAWRDTIRRLSGRGLLVPDAAELVALGAAAQAAAALTGERAPDVARRWDTRRGSRYEPLAADTTALEEFNAALRRAHDLLDP